MLQNHANMSPCGDLIGLDSRFLAYKWDSQEYHLTKQLVLNDLNLFMINKCEVSYCVVALSSLEAQC
jgi:hypothetical protein